MHRTLHLRSRAAGLFVAALLGGGVALAATWNPALAQLVGTELGRDSRAKGVHFDPLKTSFFVSRRVLSPRSGGGMPRWQDLLYIALARNATNASTFFHIPAARTVELGAQLSI